MSSREYDLLQSVIVRIFRLDDTLKLAANRISAPAGQTGARWQILNALEDAPRTVAEIARLKSVARQGVQRIVNELVAEGIVETKLSLDQGRYPRVHVTAKGQKALREIRDARRLWAEKVLAALGGGVAPEFLNFLDHFQAVVEKTIEDM
jgi:DNA-binding MarR family transcriptional regulator